MDRLHRPALHIQGAWAHGFAYHLAVADADLPKDTATNVEVIVRLLSSVAAEHGALPKGFHLQQDNTSRECKNQFIVMFAVKLVALSVFEWVTLSYLVTGHTHENIDGTFGQLTVKLAATEFNSAKEVVAILSKLFKDLGVDPGARANARAYKLDEVADWHDWWDELGLNLSRLTGPEAPHWFRICRRKDLGTLPNTQAERTTPWQVFPGNAPAAADDVMLVVKDRMASPDVLQVLTVLPAAAALGLRLRQPRGLGGRKAIREVAKLVRTATDLHAKGHLPAAAAEYLTGWAQGRLPKEPRPTSYQCLGIGGAVAGPAPAPPPAGPAGPAAAPRRGALRQPVQIGIRGTRGRRVLPARRATDSPDHVAPEPASDRELWV